MPRHLKINPWTLRKLLYVYHLQIERWNTALRPILQHPLYNNILTWVRPCGEHLKHLKHPQRDYFNEKWLNRGLKLQPFEGNPILPLGHNVFSESLLNNLLYCTHVGCATILLHFNIYCHHPPLAALTANLRACNILSMINVVKFSTPTKNSLYIYI